MLLRRLPQTRHDYHAFYVYIVFCLARSLVLLTCYGLGWHTAYFVLYWIGIAAGAVVITWTAHGMLVVVMRRQPEGVTWPAFAGGLLAVGFVMSLAPFALNQPYTVHVVMQVLTNFQFVTVIATAALFWYALLMLPSPHPRLLGWLVFGFLMAQGSHAIALLSSHPEASLIGRWGFVVAQLLWALVLAHEERSNARRRRQLRTHHS